MKILFLDRDGVINVRMPGDYVKNTGEFVFEGGAQQAIADLGRAFDRIFVVTNQSGIGKGLMTVEDLHGVHRFMLAGIEAAGGRIDAIYFCPHRSDAGCRCRKPGPGMPEQALAQFPEIVLSDAWMVGDSVCDMQMGHALGMRTVLINGKREEADALSTLPVDYRFDSLQDFAAALSVAG